MKLQRPNTRPSSQNLIEIPELPVNENNPLRPMSPYAASKVYGDFIMRNYFNSFGLDTIVSRAFNHEGAGRGPMFVTSVITDQVAKLKSGESKSDKNRKYKFL